MESQQIVDAIIVEKIQEATILDEISEATIMKEVEIETVVQEAIEIPKAAETVEDPTMSLSEALNILIRTHNKDENFNIHKLELPEHIKIKRLQSIQDKILSLKYDFPRNIKAALENKNKAYRDTRGRLRKQDIIVDIPYTRIGDYFNIFGYPELNIPDYYDQKIERLYDEGLNRNHWLYAGEIITYVSDSLKNLGFTIEIIENIGNYKEFQVKILTFPNIV